MGSESEILMPRLDMEIAGRSTFGGLFRDELWIVVRCLRQLPSRKRFGRLSL